MVESGAKEIGEDIYPPISFAPLSTTNWPELQDMDVDDVSFQQGGAT